MDNLIGDWGRCKGEKEGENEWGRKMIDATNATEARICLSPEDLELLEDPRAPTLRRISYGIILPAICCLGIIGNVLNLVVLTRRNMRGTAYIYMRGEPLHNTPICFQKEMGHVSRRWFNRKK